MKPADFGLLVAICLFWALNLVITRWVVTVGDVPPLFFAAIRVTLLAVVLSPFLFPAPRQIGMMILIAMGMAGFPEPEAMLKRLQQTVIDNGNVFEVLMDAVRCCSLGQITNALFEVGGQYRRNM